MKTFLESIKSEQTALEGLSGSRNHGWLTSTLSVGVYFHIYTPDPIFVRGEKLSEIPIFSVKYLQTGKGRQAWEYEKHQTARKREFFCPSLQFHTGPLVIAVRWKNEGFSKAMA